MTRARRLLRIVTAAIAVAVAALLAWNLVRHVLLPRSTVAVTIPAGDHELGGLLLRQLGTGPHPAVVILHGAGPDRGTELGYRVAANALHRAGLSVLLYNKRGVGRSGGDFATATYHDFVDDAVSAVRFLQARDDVAAGRIGVIGNSESGWLAPEVALRGGDAVAFVVVKSGSPLDWRRTVRWELRCELEAEGLSGDELERMLALQVRTWDYYVDAAREPALASGPERARLDAELGRLAAALGARMPLPAALPPYDPAKDRRRGINAAYDPGPFLRRLSIPVLYVFGATDVNVPVAESVAALESLHRDHPNLEWVVYSRQGHALQSWRAPLTAGFHSGYLQRVASFARAVTLGGRPRRSSPAPTALR